MEEHELDDDDGECFHLIRFALIDLVTGDGRQDLNEEYFAEHGGYWRKELKGWRGEAQVYSCFGGGPHVQGESSVSKEHALKLAAECRQMWLREVQPLPKDDIELNAIWKVRAKLVVEEMEPAPVPGK